MKLKLLAASLLPLLIFTSTASSQETGNCSLKVAQIAQAPELFGLRLGMTMEQVKTLVPTIEFGQTDELGLMKTSFSPDFNPAIAKTRYQGVRTISLEFLDGRVSSLWIGYTDTFKWKTQDEFTKGMTGALGLPDRWEMRQRGRFLECAEFQAAIVMIGGGQSLRLTDNAAQQTWEQRRTEKEESQP